jgi:signal transduction histidine kinase
MVEGMLVSARFPRNRALSSRALQLQAVYQVIRKAGSSLDLQEVLDAITRLTVEVTGVRGCSIKLLDPATGLMGVRSLAGMERQVSELRPDAAENIYARSLLDGKPVLVEGAQASDFPELDSETESLLCVPLRHEGKVEGALCVYGEKGSRLSPEMMSFLSSLGDLVIISIENASLYENLKRVDEAKSWFLRKAAHELASPLATIQSISQTFLEGYLGDLTDKQTEMLERIRLRSALLSDIVADLLVLAKGRSEAPGTGTEEVDLCGVLSETIDFFQPAASEKGVSLVIEKPCEPCLVGFSREGMHSVMTNLVSNAIKYSRPGGRVSVSLVRTGGEVELSVSDQGIGIPESGQKGLFREFFRAANARSYTEKGTGLGLAIVKSIVDRLGGRIDVQSEEGKGTTFRVSVKVLR